MSFSFDNKVAFFDSFQFLSSSQDLNERDFKHLGQEFDSEDFIPMKRHLILKSLTKIA